MENGFKKKEWKFIANQKIKVHLFIFGRVQGVFFRQFIQKRAEELGLVGWVKNLDDGRVEVVIEGDKEKIDKILVHLREGPLLAKVKNIYSVKSARGGAKQFNGVKINYEKYQGEFKDFSILLC